MANIQPKNNSEVTILVAEDSPTQADRLQYMLEQNGYRTLMTRNGKEALAMAKEQKTTLVISDIMMPEMDGYQLCRSIKEDESIRDIPVVLLTSLSDPVDVLKGLECGADNFMTKPVDEQRLMSRIGQILVNKEARRNRKDTSGVIVSIKDKEYCIKAERQQIVDLLLSTYEAAFEKNNALFQTQNELRELNETLELKVEERTESLKAEINERIQAEKEKKKMEAQFQQAQKMEAVGRLAGGVAHDFNNLLTVIIGNAELLLYKMKDGDKITEKIRIIKETGERATQLTRQLLTFSRHQVTEPVLLNMNKVIQNMSKMFPRLVGEDVNVSFDLAPDIGWVKVDPGQMEQVVLNLVVNSRDAMPRGGHLAVSTNNSRRDEQDCCPGTGKKSCECVVMSISDTGVGMPKEVVDHIFEPFYTTKKEGTGLGLSTLYGIVKSFGGQIDVDSELGKGTAFNIFLPVADEGAGKQRSAESPDDRKMPGGKETILVVEDDLPICQLTVSILKDLGYTVLSALDAESAVLKAKEHQGAAIDLLLSDVVLPDKRGPDLAGILRESCPQLKVLYMSGYTDDRILIEDITKGKAHLLTKPFSPHGLARKIREVLDSRK